MSKAEIKEKYRIYFNDCKSYIRFLPILNKLNIPQSNFSNFLNGKNKNAMTVKRLKCIRKEIIKMSKDVIESRIL